MSLGVKVGLHKVIGEYQRLISWKNIDDPAPVIFSFEIDQVGLGNTSCFGIIFVVTGAVVQGMGKYSAWLQR